MKRLLMLVFVLTLFLSLSVFAAENGENAYVKVWDSTNDDPTAGLWDVKYMGDMDGDGLKEILTCSDEAGATLYLYECSGNNDYTQVWSYVISEVLCNDSYVLAKGDLDGDGLAEIVAGVATSNVVTQFGIHIFEWDGIEGSDTYTLQTMYNVNEAAGGGGSITVLEIADFDADGVQEMFIGETINDDFFIVSLDTTSDFEFPSWIVEFEDRLDDAGDYTPWGFVAGDFDADGLTELVSTEWDFNGLIVIQVDAADTYSRELWWNDMTPGVDGAALRSLCAYDLDANGFKELILPSCTGGIIYTITNTGTFVGLDQVAGALDSLTAIDDINGAALGDQDMFLGNIGQPDLYLTGDDGEITDLEYIGGDYKDMASWELHSVCVDTNVRFQHVAIGDFDSDGLKDFVVVHKDDGQPAKIRIFEKEPLEQGPYTMVTEMDSSAYLYQTRGLCAGSDLDQDGKKEVFVTDYRGGFIHGYEVVGDNTLEYIWSSDSIKSSAASPNRNVVTGDMDNDGIGEVIFAVSGNAGDGTNKMAGLNFYEWDGSTDNGFTVYGRTMIEDALDGDRWRFEAIQAPFDVDGDGDMEIMLANNGSSNEIGDRFYIVSIDGTFESGFFSATVEGSWNQATEAFIGSPYFADYGDLDGDGTLEIIFAAWDNGGLFIVDVTGADTYEKLVYILADPLAHDGVAYGGTSIADFDGDGRDEVISPMYTGGGEDYYTTILNIDGVIADATAENNVGMVRGPWLGAGIGQCAAADFNGDGKYEFYGSNYSANTMEFSCVGTDPTVPESWEVKSCLSYNGDNFGKSSGAFAIDAADDLDGDGNPEIVVGFLDIADRTTFLQVAEYTGGTFIVKDWKVITPADYKLSQNFPNPFNPTTQINFELPLAKDVTLKIYDMLGHEVASLVNEHKQAGTYTITWNGKNNAGMNVSTGNYIYQLKAGHVVKSKVMTLVK